MIKAENQRNTASAFGRITTLVALAVAVLTAVATIDDGNAGLVLLAYLAVAAFFILISIVLTLGASAAEATRAIVVHRVDMARQTHAEPTTEVSPSGLVSLFRKGRGKRSRTSRRGAEQHANGPSQHA